MTPACAQPLICHPNTARVECPDPDCAAEPDAHSSTLPCRWAWQYAHGRGYGRPFPNIRCQACAHIRRAGMPEILIASK